MWEPNQLCKRGKQVVGIWFYDQAECDKVEALLQRIVATFQPSATAQEATPMPVRVSCCHPICTVQ